MGRLAEFATPSSYRLPMLENDIHRADLSSSSSFAARILAASSGKRKGAEVLREERTAHERRREGAASGRPVVGCFVFCCHYCYVYNALGRRRSPLISALVFRLQVSAFGLRSRPPQAFVSLTKPTHLQSGRRRLLGVAGTVELCKSSKGQLWNIVASIDAYVIYVQTSRRSRR